MPSANRNSFISSLTISMPWIYFSCLTAIARTFSAMLCKSGGSRCRCLISDLSEKAFSLSPFKYMLTVGCFVGTLFEFEEVPLYSGCTHGP